MTAPAGPSGPGDGGLAALATALGGEPSTAHGALVVDVDAARWTRAAETALAAGFTFFDWLTAVDEEEGGLRVVLSLWCRTSDTGGAGGRRLLLRCTATGEPPRVASVAHLWAGAAWAERETAEMFGLEVDGHPSPGPLLLPEGFVGHPLRKDFVLAARAARPWPGAVEPDGGSRRRPPVPPGVPGPGAFPPRDAAPGTDPSPGGGAA